MTTYKKLRVHMIQASGFQLLSWISVSYLQVANEVPASVFHVWLDQDGRSGVGPVKQALNSNW